MTKRNRKRKYLNISESKLRLHRKINFKRHIENDFKEKLITYVKLFYKIGSQAFSLVEFSELEFIPEGHLRSIYLLFTTAFLISVIIDIRREFTKRNFFSSESLGNPKIGYLKPLKMNKILISKSKFSKNHSIVLPGFFKALIHIVKFFYLVYTLIIAIIILTVLYTF